jgi:hypothetical protein
MNCAALQQQQLWVPVCCLCCLHATL